MNSFNHKSGEYLTIMSGKIYYEMSGNENKPVLLVLHGGFGTMEDLNGILDELTHRFTILGIDSRGHGKSTMGSQELTYERLQKDVEKVLEHLNITRVHIIGFSDGGVVAYRLASFSNVRIDKIVTIGSRWHWKNADATKDILAGLTAESWKTKFPASFETYQRLNPENNFDKLAKSLVNMWLDSEITGYPNDSIKNIVSPLLIIRGDNDPLIGLADVFELKGLVINSSVLNIPFAGHAAYDSQKEIIKICLKRFFDA
jgi:pimeloyl-ACP methyl ester carboxylesterase